MTNSILQASSLYVGDLHPETTEANIFEVFNAIAPGQVSSVRVCRDAVTRRSLQYAYVNYTNSADAERALDALNYEPLKERPMRIMWSQRDPSARRNTNSNVFIKSLHESVDNKALYDTFSTFGNILSCKVVADSTGASKGYGFVHYETQEAADLAIDKVNGKLLVGQKVYVARFLSRKEREDSTGESRKFTNIFVKNLGPNLLEEQLRVLCESHGTITSLVIMKDANGRSRGFGFVNFEEVEAAERAVEALNGKEVEGSDGALYFGRAQKKQERSQLLKRQYEKKRQDQEDKYHNINLYVKNLEDVVDDDILRRAFSEYGTITSARVMRDDSGKSRGFGFVCYSEANEATVAITTMDGQVISPALCPGLTKPLYVALAQRKGERETILHASRMQSMNMFPPGMAMGGMPPMAYGQQPFFYPPMGMYGGPGPRGFNGRAPRWQNPQMMPGSHMGMPPPPQQQQQRPYQGQFAGRGRRPQSARGYNQAQQEPTSQQLSEERPQDQKPSFATELIDLPENQRKQKIGERLYPLIMATQGHELAGKLTGMLLEMDDTELLHLLDDQSALDHKIDEAVDVLRKHQDDAAR